MKRINPMTEISDDEVFGCIESLSEYFNLKLETIVSRNFNKTDAMSTIEMYTFANCVKKVANKDRAWLNGHIKKIESNKNPNNTFGSLWEVVFAGLLIDSNIPVQLHTDSHPGIDVTACINTIDINFSLKRYDKSAHYINLELSFNRILKIIKEIRCSEISVTVLFLKYPDDSTISTIIKKITSYRLNEANFTESNEKYLLNIKNTVQHDNEINNKCHSYQLTIISELHKNERKNLFDKIDEAIANLEKFKKNGLNIIVIHINQQMPIDSIARYTEEYFSIYEKKDIDAVLFYQPCITADEKVTQVCHVFKSIFNQRKDLKRPTDWKIPAIVFPSGAISGESCINMLKVGDKYLNINEKYCYQAGEIFQKPTDDGNGTETGEISKRGNGILVHSTLENNGKLFVIKGNFANKDELEIL